MALATVGSAGVWGALERGPQLFTWQGLARRCEAAGWVGMLMGGVEPREAVPLLLFRRSPALASGAPREGEAAPPALCSELFCPSRASPEDGPTASRTPGVSPLSFCPHLSWVLTLRPLFLWPVWFWFGD